MEKTDSRIREYQFDNMKAGLIFLVVLGHLLSAYCETDASDAIYKIIFSFHMPAFLYISGYFARYHPKKLFSRLAPLFLLFQLLYYVIDFVSDSLYAGHLTEVGLQFFTPRFTLWYLMAMMAYQLLIPLFETNKPRRMLEFLFIFILLGMLMGMTPDSDNFMGMSRIVTFLPFFALGYYERRLRMFPWLLGHVGKKKLRIIGAILMALLIGLIIDFNDPINSHWFLGTKSYGEGGYTWYIHLAIYVAAFLWIFILMVWTPHRELPALSRIGRNTLPIYLIHGLIIHVMNVFPEVNWLRGNVLWCILFALFLTVVLSWDGFERLLRRIRIPYESSV